MTPAEAMTALLTEFNLLDCLEQWDDVVREQVREDGFEGLTDDHPKVQRYREVRETLRRAAKSVARETQDS